MLYIVYRPLSSSSEYGIFPPIYLLIPVHTADTVVIVCTNARRQYKKKISKPLLAYSSYATTTITGLKHVTRGCWKGRGAGGGGAGAAIKWFTNRVQLLRIIIYIITALRLPCPESLSSLIQTSFLGKLSGPRRIRLQN